MSKLEDLIVFPLAVVCHDAGSANVIIAWLNSYKGDFRVCMEGPARKIWKKNFPNSEIFSRFVEIAIKCLEIVRRRRSGISRRVLQLSSSKLNPNLPASVFPFHCHRRWTKT